MRTAMLVGSLMFSLVSGFYDIGLLDMIASPDDQGAVQAFDDFFPPPPNWP
jgi:hypothetical protein